MYVYFSCLTGAPEVVDWSEDHMKLEWSEPIDDGGSPITGYIVEKKARHDLEYSECLRIDGNRRKGTADHLTEGVEYQFRVIALNKAGPSEPGQPSRLKEARARFSKSYIRSILHGSYKNIALDDKEPRSFLRSLLLLNTSRCVFFQCRQRLRGSNWPTSPSQPARC